MRYLMGIDCGGTVLKTSVFDLGGREKASYGIHIPVLSDVPGRYERDTAVIADAARRSIRGAIEKAGIDASGIAGIGLTGQANGLYMFRKDGTPVAPGVMSSDVRANDLVRRFYASGKAGELLPVLRQKVYAAQTPVLMAWFAQNRPEVLAEAEVCITVKDYIRFLLTGEWAMESTELSVVSLMDQDRRVISEEVLEAFGILQYKDKFPGKILEPTEIGGTVTGRASAETGLCAGTPVAGGLFDCTANTISQGVVREDQLCIVAGSWGMNNMITKELIYSEDLFGSYLYCLQGYRQIMEGSSTSCSNLEWYVNNILKQKGLDFCGYNEVNRRIAEESRQKSGIFFLPFLYGSNVSLDARAAFIGLTGADGIPDMLRAVYEGVVFAHMDHIDRLLKFVAPPKTIRASGGGAKSDVWMQMFADALGREIEVSEAEEVGTLGCAMMAGVGTGCYRDIPDAVRECVHVKKVYDPDPSLKGYYREKYAVYQEILRSLDPVWSRIGTVGEH